MASTTCSSQQLQRALELARELKRRKPWAPLKGPQTEAYECVADITGYGGAAGGGKSDLACGLALTKHKRVLICRREKAQTEGIIQRLGTILGNTDGFNSQKSIWRVTAGSQPLIEFGGLDVAGDEQRWQGRAHDLKIFDEVTEMREHQVRFIMGWTRTDDPNIKPRVLMTFNPPTTSEARWVIKFFGPWLDKKHPNKALPGELRYFTTRGEDQDYEVPDGRPFVWGADGQPQYDFDSSKHNPEDIITPKSRTFIPAKVTDNKFYMATGYISQLQSLPEPLRSQMLYGDFQAGIKDDPWQVIPTAWVDQAMARWKDIVPKPRMDSVGVDVARGGADKTVISRRHGMWFDQLLRYPGAETPNGPVVAGLTIAAMRDKAPLHVDVIGVGSSAYDFLVESKQQTIGVNVAERATTTDKSGRLHFVNLRTQLWWKMREALDPESNNAIALPPDDKLKSDLCAPRWSLTGAKIYVESREEIIKKIGRSPDDASAVILALIDTPRIDDVRTLNASQRSKRGEYDPYS